MVGDPLLRVKGLKCYFYVDGRVVRAVDGVSFEVREGETLGLVGESGCGKTVTALSILRLVPSPPGRITQGVVQFGEEDLLKVSNKRMREIRGKEISMIFQEPRISLNPVFTIGNQIMEAVLAHKEVDRATAKEMAIEMLRKVGMPDPIERMRDYPHQLSGGMCQRAMIAMALVLCPKILIADEPTTALDVTIQAQILTLLKRLQDELRMATILITHDLGIVAELADIVAVMYAGRIVEYGSVIEIFEDPRHPYTRGLLDSIPKLGQKRKRLATIKGTIPDPADLPRGCSFHPRCPSAFRPCFEEFPNLVEVSEGHMVACYL
jgi:oligopeptide/dipeptide ABC transporter ATP-binding protein